MLTRTGIVLSRLFPNRLAQPGQSGISILELLAALGVSSLLLLLGANLTQSVWKSSSEINTRMFASMDQDLGLRWLIPIIEASSVMRLKEAGQRLIDCSNTLNLSETSVSPTPLLLSATQNHINIGFAAYRSTGSSSPKVVDAIFVPNTSAFQKGQLILLSTMDAQKRSSIYRITDVDATQSLIQLAPNLLQLPAAIDCELRQAADPNSVLNPTEPKKYLVSVLQFAKLELVEGDKDGGLNLQGLHWKRFLDQESEISSFALVKNATKLEIAESYLAQTATKGRYQANLKLTYQPGSSAVFAKSSVVEVKAGYNMIGIEVANQAAVPLPPSIEFMDVTCSLSYVTSYADYAVKNTLSTLPIHRISILVTDETRVKASSPSVTLTLLPPNSAAKIQCWNYDKLLPATDFGVHSFLLEGEGSQAISQVTLAPNANSTDSTLYFQPIYCHTTDPTQALANLKFVDSVAGMNRTITCSPATLEGLRVAWKYDGASSSCKRTGEITLGRLVQVNNPLLAGPALRFKEDGCRWSGSSSKSCNVDQVLEADPNAELLDVQLLPSDIQIQSAPNGNRMSCL